MSTVQYHQTPPTGSGDPITSLPMDKSQPSQSEINIVNTLFTKHKSTMDLVIAEVKDSAVIGLLFVVLSLPLTDNLIKKVLPITEKSPYVLIGAKAILLMALFWLTKYFYLSRRGN